MIEDNKLELENPIFGCETEKIYEELKTKLIPLSLNYQKTNDMIFLDKEMYDGIKYCTYVICIVNSDGHCCFEYGSTGNPYKRYNKHNGSLKHEINEHMNGCLQSKYDFHVVNKNAKIFFMIHKIHEKNEFLTHKENREEADDIEQIGLDFWFNKNNKDICCNLNPNAVGGPSLTPEENSKKMKKYYIENPDVLIEMSIKRNQYYIDNPDFIDSISKILIQYYKNNPNATKIISEGMKRYNKNNPGITRKIAIKTRGYKIISCKLDGTDVQIFDSQTLGAEYVCKFTYIEDTTQINIKKYVGGINKCCRNKGNYTAFNRLWSNYDKEKSDEQQIQEMIERYNRTLNKIVVFDPINIHLYRIYESISDFAKEIKKNGNRNGKIVNGDLKSVIRFIRNVADGKGVSAYEYFVILLKNIINDNISKENMNVIIQLKGLELKEKFKIKNQE